MIWLTVALLLIGCGQDGAPGANGLPGIVGPTGATGNEYLEPRISALETRIEIVEDELNKKACNKGCKKHCH